MIAHELLLVCFGLVMLLLSGEILMSGCLNLSRLARLSTFFIAAVVMGFATSLPELAVSVKSALAGASGITLGNIIGSNLANTWLIVGLSATINPIPIKPQNHLSNNVLNVLTHMILFMVFQQTFVGRWEGAILLIVFAVYFRWMCHNSAQGHQEEKPQKKQNIKTSKMKILFWVGVVLVSLVGLIISAEILVDAATVLAHYWGVEDKVIAISLVGLGTSLPEVAMAVVAARGPEPALIFSNVLGSNIFNILLILGVTSCISPIKVPHTMQSDMLFAVISSLILALLIQKSKKITRLVGVSMLAIYSIYIMLIYTA